MEWAKGKTDFYDDPNYTEWFNRRENEYKATRSTLNPENLYKHVDGYAHFWDPDPAKIVASQGDMTIGENYYYGGLLRFDLSPKSAYHKMIERNGQVLCKELILKKAVAMTLLLQFNT